MQINKSTTVGQIVAYEFQTAKIFEKYNIDFCCKGHIHLEDACKQKQINYEELVTQLLTEINSKSPKSGNPIALNPIQLIDHIISKHHRYIINSIPSITSFLTKLSSVHGHKHQELHQIRSEFTQATNELADHMRKEELVLFPIIKNLYKLKKDSYKVSTELNNAIIHPIKTMMHEHEIEVERFESIKLLSSQYTGPEDGCITYHVTYKMLKDFHQDLHEHIHLENNVLFPMALKLEMEVSGTKYFYS